MSSPASTISKVESPSKFFTPSDERSFCFLLDNLEATKDRTNLKKIKIYVSKELLAAASPVFKKLFYGGNFYQARIEPIKEYHLVDKKINDILEFLECLFPYPDRKKIDQSNALIVLPLAMEFQVEILIKKCLKLLKSWKLTYAIGDEAVLKDLLIFVKYGMKNLLKEAVPYAAALSLEILNAYRKRNSAQVPGNHAFYLAVYEAKANRDVDGFIQLKTQFMTNSTVDLTIQKSTSNETHVPVTENNGRKKPAEDEKAVYCSLYECYCGEVVTVRCSKCSAPLCDLCKPEKCSSFHHCKTYGSSAACLCGYDFDEQFLSM